jgi:hypothetical protein
MAVVFGMVGGTALFVATVWLVIRGGPNVGEHLGLLRYYFPGFTVTWPGAFLGFFYGMLAGALAGGSVAWVYNRVAAHRQSEARTGALRKPHEAMAVAGAAHPATER